MQIRAIRKAAYAAVGLTAAVALVGSIVSAAQVVGAALSCAVVALAVVVRSEADLAARRHADAERRLLGAVRASRRVTSRTETKVARALTRLRRSARTQDRLLQAIRTAARTVDDQQVSADLARQDLQRSLAGVERRAAYIESVSRALKTSVERLPGTVSNLSTTRSALETDPRPMPVPGGWAATAATIDYLVDLVRSDAAVRNVVECGSGTSTVWVALALRARGADGHVYSLEHDAYYASQTRAELAAHGLEDRATVIHAPLESSRLDDHSSPWYSEAAWRELLPDEIDLLFVDGPPGTTGADARYPAVPRLEHRLHAGSVVVLDDTDRSEEQRVRDRWVERARESRFALVVERTIDRSTVLAVERR